MNGKDDASNEEANNGIFPAEVLERIFSFTDRPTTHGAMSTCRFFYSSLQKLRFRYACEYIENDPNYLPHITNVALMRLVQNAEGIARHVPARTALAIKHYKDVIVEKEMIYRFYQIFIAGKHYDPDSECRMWGIDNTGLIRVAKDTAELTFHGIDHVSKGQFDVVLTHNNPYNFLNHTNPVIEQNANELQGNNLLAI